jgi:hypothetical protein
MTDAWKPIATRGEFTLMVKTRARATLDGADGLHANLPLLGVFIPDDDTPPTEVWFLSEGDLCKFVAEMAPHTINFSAAPAEDVSTLRMLLVGGAVH